MSSLNGDVQNQVGLRISQPPIRTKPVVRSRDRAGSGRTEFQSGCSIPDIHTASRRSISLAGVLSRRTNVDEPVPVEGTHLRIRLSSVQDIVRYTSFVRSLMNIETILTFSAVAFLAIVSPGPAILLALRNSVAFGVRAVIWSSLGNVSGLFCLSAAAMLGLGVLLKSSALLFGAVKLLGALYLFYVGVRHLVGRASILSTPANPSAGATVPSPSRLYREAFLMAATNPKPILFFTALFPQFIDAHAPLPSQFFGLTGIFMALSFLTLMGYATLGAQARQLLLQPVFSKWVNRVVGTVFISFGAALLAVTYRFNFDSRSQAI